MTVNISISDTGGMKSWRNMGLIADVRQVVCVGGRGMGQKDMSMSRAVSMSKSCLTRLWQGQA